MYTSLTPPLTDEHSLSLPLDEIHDGVNLEL